MTDKLRSFKLESVESFFIHLYNYDSNVLLYGTKNSLQFCLLNVLELHFLGKHEIYSTINDLSFLTILGNSRFSNSYLIKKIFTITI